MQSIAPMANPATGERFEFVSSARDGDGRFRFRWTLAPRRRGPPEHRHLHERETFTLVSGSLRVWVDGVCRELRTGEPLTAEVGTYHRFYNPGDTPAVIDVELDGAELEDTMVPMAAHFAGREKQTLAEVIRIFLHDVTVGATVRKSLFVRGLLGFFAALGRLFRLTRFPVVEQWKPRP